ncbi:hypothetical protein FACS189441_7610 [Betaproteobacteria bacterium]|nr:hypothetical protein FACS189441_7610 [Betaproteobacteria bacterium]
MKDTEQSERIILAVLDQIGEGISDDAAKIVRELVDHNETGASVARTSSVGWKSEAPSTT